MIFLTTTAIEIDEELSNRCLVLTVGRKTGADARDPRAAEEAGDDRRAPPSHDRDQILKRHKNAQRLLRPILVANPYPKGSPSSTIARARGAIT